MDIEEICRQHTELTGPQITLLQSIEQLLPFASSASRQEVFLFIRETGGGILVAGHYRDGSRILFRDREEPTTLQPYEAPVWQQLLLTGKKLQGLQERAYGEMARLAVFPVVDNGGKIIAGISFVDTGIDKSIEEYSWLLAETAYMAAIVPDKGGSNLYRPLSYQDGIIIFDEGGKMLYVNEAAARLANLLGFDRRLVGTSIYGGTLKLSQAKQAIAAHQGAVMEELYGDIVLEQTIIPVLSGGKTHRRYLFLRDKTEIRRKEQELLVKNSVIKEIHHRVKNNLQAVSGLLRMQARRSDSPEVKAALQEGIHRIESMSLVHEVISHYDEDSISLRTIAEELLRLLKRSMAPAGSTISCEFDGDEIVVSSNQASYISLIINELISNSLEHGFSEGDDGSVTIRALERSDGQVELIAEDTGRGFDPNFDFQASKRLGLQIIRSLVDNELKGTVTFLPAEPHGTRVSIIFTRED